MIPALLYGLRAAARRRRTMVTPMITTATGSTLVVLVLGLLPAVRRQAAQFGDPGDLSRTTVAVSLIVLTVGAIEVAIGATRSVLQRRSEVGLLSATGVPPGRVMAALLMEPVITALAGSFVGALLGLGTAMLLVVTGASRVSAGPGALSLGIAVAIMLSLTASVVASLLPIVRAVRRPPVESLGRLQ